MVSHTSTQEHSKLDLLQLSPTSADSWSDVMLIIRAGSRFIRWSLDLYLNLPSPIESPASRIGAGKNGVPWSCVLCSNDNSTLYLYGIA